MWLTLIAAAFFALVLIVILLRAERTVANGALTVITLVAVAVAAAATTRGFGPGGAANVSASAPMPPTTSLPALSCIDDLAGDSVETACERILFGSPDNIAAAVSYAAAQINTLTAFGDVSTANRVMTPELQALRSAVERDRYGLIAHVLTTRDRCSVTTCAVFQSLTDHNHIIANMEERAYNGRVTRYAVSWDKGENSAASGSPALAGVPATLPTGKPTNAEFPSAASIPPVNIMTPEPPPPSTASTTSPASAATPVPAARPAAAAKSQAASQQPVAARKKSSAAPKAAPAPSPPPPVQLAPAAPADAR